MMNSTNLEELYKGLKNNDSTSTGFLWTVLFFYSGLIIVGCIGNILVYVVAVQEKGEH